MAALEIFGLLWGQLQVAHMLKDVKGDWRHLRFVPALALLCSMPLLLLPSQAKKCLPPAAFSCGLYLLFYGSRSNHIMQDCIINLTVVLAAAGPSFEKSLAAAVHWYLVVLYFISAMHKLNSDWFDTRAQPSECCGSRHVSCASSVTGTLLAQYVPTTVPAGSSLSRLLLESAPYAAVAFEVFLPSLLALAPPGRSTFWQGACIRLAVVLGSIFHLTLALPLPPASFYPFSASCLALYPLLMPDACEKLAQLREFGWGKLVGLSLPGLMLSICAAANLSEGVTYEQAGQCNRCSAEEAGAWSSWLKGGPQDVPFEYPPYDLYNAGICWCLGVTTFLSLLALLGKGSNEDGRPVSAAAAIAVVATLLLGLGPYLGTRTYPAFAMFSNLRVEGSRPNHLLLGGGLDLLGLQSDAVEVLETNSSDLQSFQVDLSQLFTSQTQSYFAAAGLEKALWICPPKWPHSVEFQAFSAPALGLWQRFNHHENGTEKQWYARVRRGGVETIVRSIDDFKGRCDRGVPGWLCKLLGPFRSFNDEHSPCRH
eukprot:s1242_g5.t6